MKDVGLVGLPYSGKSTLFTALTHAGAAGGRANQAVVPVPDPRIEVLSELEGSRKRVRAQVRFTDVPAYLRQSEGYGGRSCATWHPDTALDRIRRGSNLLFDRFHKGNRCQRYSRDWVSLPEKTRTVDRPRNR